MDYIVAVGFNIIALYYLREQKVVYYDSQFLTFLICVIGQSSSMALALIVVIHNLIDLSADVEDDNSCSCEKCNCVNNEHVVD